SCLLVLSRDMPIIWPIARWVTLIFRSWAEARPDCASWIRTLASRVGRSRNVTRSTWPLVLRSFSQRTQVETHRKDTKHSTRQQTCYGRDGRRGRSSDGHRAVADAL